MSFRGGRGGGGRGSIVYFITCITNFNYFHLGGGFGGRGGGGRGGNFGGRGGFGRGPQDSGPPEAVSTDTFKTKIKTYCQGNH